MELKELVKFEQSDLSALKQFQAVVNSGEFQFKGDAVEVCGSLFGWLRKLEGKIEDAIKKQALAEASIKPMNESKVKPIKKGKK